MLPSPSPQLPPDSPSPGAAPADSFAFMAQVLDALPAYVSFVDADLRYRWVNRRYEEWFGRPREQIIGRPLADLMSDEQFRSVEPYARRALAGESVHYELEMSLPVGGTSVFDVSYVPAPSGGGFHVLSIDRSDERRAESALQLAAKVYETAGEGIVIADAEQRIVSVNRAYREITGQEEAEVIGRNVLGPDGVLGMADYPRGMCPAVALGGQWQGEVPARRRGGGSFPAWLSVSAVRGAGGEISHFVGIVTDITTLKESQRRLEELANYDALTGLPNRNLFQDRFRHALESARRGRHRLALMFIDLDDFKIVNDTLGHDAGDELLRKVAGRLAQGMRQQDTVARLGGDEFVVMLDQVADPRSTAAMAERIAECFRSPFEIQGREHFVTMSMGIALCPDDGDQLQTLLKNADLALYRAKEQGRNCFRFFTEDLNVQAFERLFLEAGLRRALERGELVLHYQPVVDLASGRTEGYEALVRWEHPDLGRLPPDRFVPVAEQSQLIVQIGEWVLETACRQAAAWARKGSGAARVAINVSARQLRDRTLVGTVARTLEATGVDPARIELELTESAVMHDADEVAAILHELRELGVRLTVDDFGTGYSSLAYLKRFPIDALKIDRTFVRDLDTDPDDAAIVTAIITMAHSLGIRAIAEGVENAAQAAFLIERGCDFAQGMLYGAPAPVG